MSDRAYLRTQSHCVDTCPLEKSSRLPSDAICLSRNAPVCGCPGSFAGLPCRFLNGELSSPCCAQELSQGYFQPNVGGENIPTAQGELSDLAGDEPLFKALYQWCTSCSACLTP